MDAHKGLPSDRALCKAHVVGLCMLNYFRSRGGGEGGNINREDKKGKISTRTRNPDSGAHKGVLCHRGTCRLLVAVGRMNIFGGACRGGLSAASLYRADRE